MSVNHLKELLTLVTMWDTSPPQKKKKKKKKNPLLMYNCVINFDTLITDLIPHSIDILIN